ncbi:MAG: hypothetical protein HY866_03365 [Chloroflexi bacterium]|nr:hypothetical protein [Chloroflexota bacterium]
MELIQLDTANTAESTHDTVYPATDTVESLANRLASELAPAHVRAGVPLTVLAKPDTLEELFTRAYQHFAEAAKEELVTSYAGEWMLDNFYIIRQTLREIIKDMPAAYYARLPKLTDVILQEYPRVYALARPFTRFLDSHISEQTMCSFLDTYQMHTALTMGELWAWPVMLRVSVLENLAFALVQLIDFGPNGFGGFIHDMAAGEPIAQLDAEVTIANCITSLRNLNAQDWQQFFEDVSRVEKILRRDPANVYAHMDFATRNHYRRTLEELARHSPHNEVDIAQCVLELAQQAAHNQNENQELPFIEERNMHVGFYLIASGRPQLEVAIEYHRTLKERIQYGVVQQHRVLLYLGALLLITLFITLNTALYAASAGGSFLQVVVSALLILIPASIAASHLVNWGVTQLVKPALLPKLDFSGGIPLAYQTIVVMPALLTDKEEVNSLAAQVEQHYLRNTDRGLYFALLLDYTDAPHEQMPGDAALAEYAQERVGALNERYGTHEHQPFFLFLRRRLWNPSESCWMGYERKRGKLMEFNRLVLDPAADSSYILRLGNLSVLPHMRYVITLDADTVLPLDAAARLVGTLAHPLNQAEFMPGDMYVTAGYTVLQPRVELLPTTAAQTPFARIYGGNPGIDLYTLAVSDVYQDLFGEGIYVGKGIYDIRAFEKSLNGCVPENSLLSHDLFEGLHGRAGLVTDITLLEEYPSHYLAYTNRMHRWIRGDWQLLPWLLPRVPFAGGGSVPNRLGGLALWKIIDNLRRSLLQPALLLFLVASWLWLPGSPFVWTFFFLIVSWLPFMVSFITVFERISPGKVWSLTRQHSLVTVFVRWGLSIAFLQYEAMIALDAIFRTLGRLARRKHLLQWTTAASVTRMFNRQTKSVVWQQMLAAVLVTVALGSLVLLTVPATIVVALPLLVAWISAPYLAERISQPYPEKIESLDEEQWRQLRTLARRTWLFFEEFVGPEEHWLPPDHYQRVPRGVVKHYTSPTNIGLMLLSTLSAYDLGYIGLLELTLRLQFAFDSVARLERYRGHLLNWYGTQTLQPLAPRYVSTVDSGNYAGCLLALKQGCRDLIDIPTLRGRRWQGALDILDLLIEILDRVEDQAGPDQTYAFRNSMQAIRQRIIRAQDAPTSWMEQLTALLETDWNQMSTDVIVRVESGQNIDVALLTDLRIYLERLRHHLFGMQRDIELLLPWMVLLDGAPTHLKQPNSPHAEAWQNLLDALPDIPPLGTLLGVYTAARRPLASLRQALSADEEALAWCDRMAQALDAAQVAAGDLITSYESLQERIEAEFEAIDFSFLYSADRHLFHVGYNVDREQLDQSYYDLLASEARLASFIAIAKHNVPQKHWLHLSRPMMVVNSEQTLLSWGGTMFEYLMPLLLLQNHRNSLLYQTCQTAVLYHIQYGRRHRIPWGISESGYYAFDGVQNYQYRAFGVPDLALKRGQETDLVVAPYASVLSLPFQPRATVDNIREFARLQALDTYGLVEAIDYSTSRLPLGQKYMLVREYMAHHQGMVLVTLANFVQDNIMVRRFHADPRIESAQLLLLEQIPQEITVEERVEESSEPEVAQPQLSIAPWEVAIDTPLPQAHYLSNGRYTVMVTNAGSGQSLWGERALTRWRADTTLDDWGTWIYIRDQDSGLLWSAGHQPIPDHTEAFRALFHPHKAEFQRRSHDISSQMEIVVSNNNDLEIRRILLTNHSDVPRRLLLTSYSEMVLALQNDDQRHPAFNKMFIESEYLPDLAALVFHRRLRSTHDEPLYVLHMLVLERGTPAPLYETDRAEFIGRNHTCRNPQALIGEQVSFKNTSGTSLDPVMALGQIIELEPRSTAQLAYITIAASSRQAVINLAYSYQKWMQIDYTFDQTRYYSERELRNLSLDTNDLARIERLLSALLYPHAMLRADADTLAANTKAQTGLWAYGISGDYPILLVDVSHQDELELIRELLQAHRFWRNRGFKSTLVILNQHDVIYMQELYNHIYRLIVHMGSETWINRHDGIFILRGEQMSEADRVLLRTAARVYFRAEDGMLEQQLGKHTWETVALPDFRPTLEISERDEFDQPLARPENLLFDNGLGGFAPDGREYVIYHTPNQTTPAPWINVVANDQIGFIVSEAGSGFSWVQNSGENRLTVWRNDPVSDMPGEALYLRDEETAAIWSPTPLPAGDGAPYIIRHGAGYTSFEHNSHQLQQTTRLYTAPDAPVKFIRLHLRNMDSRPRRITVTYYAEWVLGTTKDKTQQYLIPSFNADSRAVLVRNPYNVEFGDYRAFVTANKPFHGITTDRAEFLGRTGSFAHPVGLTRIGLSSTVRAGQDLCAAVLLHIDLPPEGEEEVCFMLGAGANEDQALELIHHYQTEAAMEEAWQATNRFWRDLLDGIIVRTPDAAMNVILPWLLYQTLSCRIWGRSALYQSSGAYGFRDQLQDVLALVHVRPDLTREHILRAAHHQFEAGDVLHWWHPPSVRGVRTRFADDLVWLPFVVACYVSATGDESILHEEVPFLKGDLLRAGEQEYYGLFESSDESYTLYEHCCRALNKGYALGQHKLPLMSGGDWNDGMNRVGIEGRGESIWMAWFLYAAMDRFLPLCQAMGDSPQAETYRQRMTDLKNAVEQNAWDGEWYLRAYYDSGIPLGSAQNLECKIDSLSQSWSVLSGAADPSRAAQAMRSVSQHLIRDRFILLFTPPFDHTPHDPGYIKGYPPGVRENGGQYTHAALWVVWAFAEMGQGSRAEALFRLLNPIYHTQTPADVQRYAVEPYVVAADVYGVPPLTGRGGWTWYSGSSGWMYRLGIEMLLGLRREGSELCIDPCIPAEWPAFEVDYRYEQTVYHVRVENPDHQERGIKAVSLDGEQVISSRVPLVNDGGTHQVVVILGTKPETPDN